MLAQAELRKVWNQGVAGYRVSTHQLEAVQRENEAVIRDLSKGIRFFEIESIDLSEWEDSSGRLLALDIR